MTGSTAVPDRLTGTFVEACDCQALCPCWVGQPPDENACTGLFGWLVDEGTIDGRDAAGIKVVSVSYQGGNRADAQQQVAVFVDGPDDKLDDETLDLVARVFSGGAGGPLEGLGGLLGRLVNAPAQGGGPDDAQARVRRSIDVTGGGAGEMSVRVTPRDGPPLVDVAARALTGESGVPMQIDESAFSRTLGAPATLGVTGRFNLSVPGLDPDRPGGLDLQSRSATTGRFAYDSTQAGGGGGGGGGYGGGGYGGGGGGGGGYRR